MADCFVNLNEARKWCHRHFVNSRTNGTIPWPGNQVIAWQIFEALQGSERERPRELWGRLFELFNFDLLGHYHPAMSPSPRMPGVA